MFCIEVVLKCSIKALLSLNLVSLIFLTFVTFSANHSKAILSNAMLSFFSKISNLVARANFLASAKDISGKISKVVILL